MYEQYIEADLKRKRKKSALQLNTPEGLDYIRVARLHDIVRCSSISILLIFILFQGVALSVFSIILPNLILSTPIVIDIQSHYYWTAVGFSGALLLTWLLTWLFFICWVPRATTFTRISIQQSLTGTEEYKFVFVIVKFFEVQFSIINFVVL